MDFIFPFDSITTHLDQTLNTPNSQATTTVISAIPGQSIRILSAHIVPKAAGITRLMCNSDRNLIFASNAVASRVYDTELMNFKNCIGGVQAEVTTGTIAVGSEGGSFISITYQQTATNTMATDTPYIQTRSIENGVEYRYDPLHAQIGYGLWIITTLIFSYFVFLIMRRKK